MSPIRTTGYRPTPVLSAIMLDFRLQQRYGFYYAAVFSALLWIAGLVLVPEGLLGPAMPYVIFGDLAIVGFFFIAGAVFFEKDERTVAALLTTPLRFGDYLAAKLTTLTVLAVVVSLVVTLIDYGLGFGLLALLAGVVLTSLIMLLVGFVTSAPLPSISEWVIPATLPLLVLNLPLLHYSGLWPHPALYAIPTQGSLMLLGQAFGQLSLSAWQLGYAIGYQLLWIAGLCRAARWVFDRYIVAKAGGD